MTYRDAVAWLRAVLMVGAALFYLTGRPADAAVFFAAAACAPEG